MDLEFGYLPVASSLLEPPSLNHNIERTRMNIITLLGSPRKRGNTATVLDLFGGQVAPTHRVERINIVDYTVRGCLGSQ